MNCLQKCPSLGLISLTTVKSLSSAGFAIVSSMLAKKVYEVALENYSQMPYNELVALGGGMVASAAISLRLMGSIYQGFHPERRYTPRLLRPVDEIVAFHPGASPSKKAELNKSQ